MYLVVGVYGNCTYEGSTYETGAVFRGMDKCNSCKCSEDGVVLCTEMACAQMCESGGRSYHVGESFIADDGCNQCNCGAKGMAACTRKACPPGCFYNEIKYTVGDSFESTDGCNTCKCGMNHQVGCTKMACLNAPRDKNEDIQHASEKPSCFYDNKYYFAGETFQEKGRCNQCKCSKHGDLACTERWCDGLLIQDKCQIGGKSYKQGDKFTSLGECDCYCAAPGAVVCNLSTCAAPIEAYMDNGGASMRVKALIVSTLATILCAYII